MDSYDAGLPGRILLFGHAVTEDPHTTITTADDIISDLFFKSRAFTLWAYNDACPPSPGCAFPRDPPAPSDSGIDGATVCNSRSRRAAKNSPRIVQSSTRLTATVTHPVTPPTNGFSM